MYSRICCVAKFTKTRIILGWITFESPLNRIRTYHVRANRSPCNFAFRLLQYIPYTFQLLYCSLIICINYKCLETTSSGVTKLTEGGFWGTRMCATLCETFKKYSHNVRDEPLTQRTRYLTQNVRHLPNTTCEIVSHSVRIRSHTGKHNVRDNFTRCTR